MYACACMYIAMLCSLGSVKHSIVATHTPHAAHPGAIFLRINHAVFVVACKVTAKDPHLLRVPLDPEIAFFSKRGVPTVANQPVVDLRDWISICADDGHSVVDFDDIHPLACLCSHRFLPVDWRTCPQLVLVAGLDHQPG